MGDLTIEQMIERAVADVYGTDTPEYAAALVRCRASLTADTPTEATPAGVTACNTGEVVGRSSYIVVTSDEMRAFDALPAEVRAALRDACVKWGAGQILDELRQGRTTRADIVSRLQFEDRKMRERVYAR